MNFESRPDDKGLIKMFWECRSNSIKRNQISQYINIILALEFEPKICQKQIKTKNSRKIRSEMCETQTFELFYYQTRRLPIR